MTTSGPDAGLVRSTAAMTVLTAVSRVTGFVRILVVAAVLGTTYLGNTYQAANTVPNLVFELFAAGALQAVVIPGLVELLDRGDRREAQHVAGSVLGLVGAGLAALAAVGMLLAPLLMAALVSGAPTPEIRDAQVRLGTVFLWFFLPQVVLYAAAMVATGVLNAQGRFALPAAAPILNNVVVTATYGAFWWMRGGAEPSLELTGAQQVVLAGGTTLGVVALTVLPVGAVLRSGFSLRPRFDHRHPAVRRLGRLGAWAAVYLAMSQVLLAAVLVLANAVEGGVVVYQVAFTFFLLPHALFAVPILTTLYPRLARHAQRGSWADFGRGVEQGLRGIAFFALLGTAGSIALARPLADAFLFGATGPEGAEQVARTIAAFAPGLFGYGAMLFLTRGFYAIGDSRLPALVNTGVAVAGVVLMVGVAAVVDDAGRVAALAGVHSAVHLAGAAVLVGLLRVRRPDAPVRAGRALGAGTLAAVGAGLVMVLVRAGLGLEGRAGAVAELVVAGGAGVAVYLALQVATGGLRPGAALALAGRRGRGGGDGRG